jgi:uncharacterized protein (TIGR03437 family)
MIIGDGRGVTGNGWAVKIMKSLYGGFKMSKIAVLALLLPVAAFADISGTATVNAGGNFSLDNGANVSSGGDISFTGTNLTYVGSAKGGSLALLGSGAAAYASLTSTELTALGSLATTTPIPVGSLPVGTIVGVATNGGNPAKMLITASSAASISFQYTTYETTAPNTPTITQIQNNYGLILPGLPNYGIAPGSLFIIRGTNLASVPVSSITKLQDSTLAGGIPTTLNGATITVTVGSYTAHPGMYYAGATQIAAVLPSATPVGTGTITVNYSNGTSNAAALTVVSSALGLDTYYGSGTGLGVATDLNYSVFNYTNSAKPGQNIILWGSGLGATTDSDTSYTSSPTKVNVPLTIYIGGIQANILYQGGSGFPGLNQIDVTIPASVPTGCGISVVGVSGNFVSNTITLPIGQGGGVCTDPTLGYNGTQLGTLAGKTNYNEGILFITQSTSAGQTTSGATGIFENVQGASSTNITGLTSVGSCNINSTVVGGTAPTITGLDAGTITVTGPTGTQTLSTIPQAAGLYDAQLPAGFIPASGGSYTFKGSGGAQVGSFSASVAYTNPLTWTNSSADTSVNRANGVNLTWSGGASGSIVYIGGTSSSSSVSSSFTCYAPVSAGAFTVPSYVLLALPAGTGTLGITNEANPVSFTASGLDTGILFGGVTFSINATYN